MSRTALLALLSGVVSPALGDFTISSGFEFWDGMDPVGFSAVLGQYGAVESANFETSGCHSGERCLKVTERVPLDGTTPQVYLAYLTDIQEGDLVSASFWGKGSGTTTKARLWAHYTEHDHTDYDGSASGPSTYAGLNGVWEKTEHTWAVPEGKTGMVIEARLYAYDGGFGDEPAVWVDDLTVTIASATGLVGTAPAYESNFETPGTVLGTFTYDYSTGADTGNLQVEQVDTGCYSYPSCFNATEDPLAGSPQVWLASVYNLSPFDHVYAQLWVKGAGSTTKSRLWGSYFEGEHDVYAAAHPEGGPSQYKGEGGLWGLSAYSWPITHGHTGLLIQARVYAYEPAFNSVLMDNLLISTNSTTAYVLMAPKAAQAEVSPSPRAPPPPSPSPPPPSASSPTSGNGAPPPLSVPPPLPAPPDVYGQLVDQLQSLFLIRALRAGLNIAIFTPWGFPRYPFGRLDPHADEECDDVECPSR